MKDLNYFLGFEDGFCQSNISKYDMENEGISNPLEFLRTKPFHNGYENIAYSKELTKNYDLSDLELIVLGMFIMKHSAKFRDDYYLHNEGQIPIIAMEMFKLLNEAISKSPITNSGTLYRHCTYPDMADLKVGEKIFVPHNLTCSKDLWKNHNCNVYVIKTLPKGKTKAHDLYKMYPHNIREQQVNFLRGTSFHITKIEPIDGKEYSFFYMEELDADCCTNEYKIS